MTAPAMDISDPKMFEALFRDHYAALKNYANTFIHDKMLAEEIVQEVFTRVWEKRDQLEIDSSIRSYLFGSVRNTALNWIKHEKVKARYADHSKSNPEAVQWTALEALDLGELQDRLTQILHALPEQCGKVFKLSRFEDKKYREIAEEMNLSVKTVENHMGRALKALREGLKGYGPYLWLLLIHNILSLSLGVFSISVVFIIGI